MAFSSEEEQRSLLARARYQSRRGMLELDVFLIPFVERFGTDWSKEQLLEYLQLLDEADPDLFAWCMAYEVPPDPYRAWISEIREYRLKHER